MGDIMMEEGIKKELLFMEALKHETLDKGKLFSGLAGVIGRDTDLKNLHLPSSPNIVRLQSNLIKGKYKMNQPRISKCMHKILTAGSKEQKQELAVRLKYLTPQKNEYAVMAMDNYLNLDKSHTIDGFYQDYEDFRAGKLNSKNNDKKAQNVAAAPLLKGLMLKESSAVI